jgi:hypothetical protein
MSAILSLSATDLDEDDLQNLTHRLCRDLRDEVGINVHLVTQPAAIGHKGDLSALGQIVLSGLGAGGFAVALVNVLKSYIERKPSLQFELQKKDGDKLTIRAEDLRGDDMTRLTQVIKEAVEGKE